MKNCKIATWNVGSMHKSDSESDHFLSAISKVDADLFCFQELPENEELFSKIMYAGNFSGYKFVRCSESHIGNHRNMGIALFSKTEVLQSSVFKLPKPFSTLVNNHGVVEAIHDKYFFAALTYGIWMVTGHSYPCMRYCSPRFVFDPSMRENRFTFDTSMKDKWRSFCVNGEDYAEVFESLERWIFGIKPSMGITVLAGDFNIDDPLSLMPQLQKYYFDVFEGEMTRPSDTYGYEYKTDAIIIPRGVRIFEKHIYKEGFDHYIICAKIGV